MKIDLKYAVFFTDNQGIFNIKEVSKDSPGGVRKDVFITIYDTYIKYTWIEENKIHNAIYNGLYRITY